MSQQLATLEREVGLPLIERTAHSASLTDAGHELVEHASAILAAVESAETRMRARIGTIAGRVRISFIPDWPRPRHPTWPGCRAVIPP